MASGSYSLHSDKPLQPNYRLVEHAIDINGLDLNATKMTIYGVPHNVRKLNKEAYTPQFIFIGPIQFEHPPRPKLIQFQMQKAKYFESWWIRVMKEHKNDEDLRRYTEPLKEEKVDLRHRYAVEFRRSIHREKQFLDMLLLNSVFIMELCLRTYDNKSSGKYQDDNILKQKWLSESIQRDLALLENQIPFSILVRLYEKVVPKKDRSIAILLNLPTSTSSVSVLTSSKSLQKRNIFNPHISQI